MNICAQLKTMGWLIVSDLQEYRRGFFSKAINFYVWFICNLMLSAYLLPLLGMGKTYGILMLANSFSTLSCFESSTSVFVLASDIESTKVINYYAILPLPAWMMLLRKAISLGILYTLLSLFMIPMGKIILFKDFSLMAVNWFYFISIMVLGNLMYGTLVVFLVSLVKGVNQVGSVWIRIIQPLWFLAGFVSWQTMHQAYPTVASVNLFNPLLCVTEGFRVAVLGQQGMLNFWLCILVTIVMTVLFAGIGISRIKRRLNFV